MFIGNNSTPLSYTPDFDKENQLQAYYTIIKKKISFFSLSEVEINKLKTAAYNIDAASIFGLQTESLDKQSPEDIYTFCRTIENTYGEPLTHFKEWREHTYKTLSIKEAKDILLLIKGLSANNNGEVTTDDFNDINNYFNYIKSPQKGGVFTQSWMLRIAMRLLQPFKNQTISCEL